MPFKVPQNIDIEDKVIGPLTLKQFIYVAVGAGIIFIIRMSIPEFLSFLFLPIAVIVGAFFLALAFFKPGDRDFEIYLLSIATTLMRPKKRIWKKEPIKEKPKEEAPKEEEPVKKNYSTLDLERLAFIVDSGGFEDELKNRGIAVGMSENKKLEESADLEDTLAAAETPKQSLSNLIKEATEKVKKEKKEPSVQEIASVNPNKSYTYDKLGKSSSGLTEYEDILKNAKENQEERFNQAKIQK